MSNNNLIPTKNGYFITDYNEKYDAGLAQMWNESDDQWPGTFNEGVPQTEDRVNRWMRDITTLQRFVGLTPEGKVVGYGDLWAAPSRPRSAYVALLNVHPKHQGNSICRAMLQEMVDWCVVNEYDRITIGTWASNLKAMPLYKKVGFFWQPDTSVHMENYVAAIRQLPQASAFFEQHDWYQTYARELAQVEDEMRHDGTSDTKVYILRWEAEGDFIEAVIDRYAQALTGFSNPQFSAYAFAKESEPAQGLLDEMHWRITNTSQSSLTVSLFASGDQGVKLDYRETFSVEAGETRTFSSAYLCEVDAPKYDRENLNKPSPAVKTVMVVNGKALAFRTGVRYQYPVKVTVENDNQSLLPGQAQTLTVQLKSQVKAQIEGTVVVMPQDGLETDWLAQKFEIEPEGYWGMPLSVTCHNAGEIPLQIKIRLKNAGGELSLPIKQFPLLAVEPGGFAAGTGEDLLILENDFFTIKIRPTGGEMQVRNKELGTKYYTLKEELGPPYIPRELGSKTYHMQLKHENGSVSALLTAESGRFPGITLARKVTVTGSPVIKLGYQVTNDQDTEREFVVRTVVLNHLTDNDMRIAPVADQPAMWPGALWASEEDIPEKPERFKEQWIANQLNGQTAGIVWQGEMDKIGGSWSRMFFGNGKMTLAPQESAQTPDIYMYQGPGEWTAVRALWKRVHGSKERKIKLAPQPTTRTPHKFGFTPETVMTLSDEVEAQVQISSTRHVESTGLLKVTPPEGWMIDQNMFPFENLMVDTPVEETAKLTAKNITVGVAAGELIYENEIFTDQKAFSVLRLGDERKSVSAGPDSKDNALWTVDNGAHTWQIAPTYGGGLVSWREANGTGNKDVNHVYTAYPEEGELSWFKPWFGGLHPYLSDRSRSNDWPGKLYKEKFTAETIEQSDSRGFVWRGIALKSKIQRDNLDGLNIQLDYLTLPGSNVLKFNYTLNNTLPVYREVEAGMMAFLQPDGSFKNTTLHGDNMNLKRSNQNTWILTGAWGGAENKATGRTIVMVSPTGAQRTFLADWGQDGGHMIGFEEPMLAPNSWHTITLYLALANSVEEAERFEAIKDLK